MDSTYKISDIKDTLYPIFAQYGVRKATLFGSYAKDTATTRSDIDIMVDSGLCGLAFFELLESVSCAFHVPVDLIDVTQLEPGSFADNEIQNCGIVIYGE